MKREKKLYLLVTADKYELPLAVGNSMRELTKYDGSSVDTLFCRMTRKQNGAKKGYRVISIKED